MGRIIFPDPMPDSHKRVLIFSTNYLPFVGGAEVALKELTDRLTDIAFEMIVPRYDKRLSKEEQIGNILVHRIGYGSPLDKIFIPFLGLLAAHRIIATRKIDVFWAMMVTFTSGVPYIFNILHPKRQIPIVLTLQEGDSEAHIKRKSFGIGGILWKIAMLPVLLPLTLRRPNVRIWNTGLIELSWQLALPRTALLTVISSYLKERARFFGYAGPAELIPNGVDYERFADPKWKMEAQKLVYRFDKKPNDYFLITTSRLVEKNAVDDIIRALPLLHERFKLLIVGEGPMRTELQKLAEKLGVSRRIMFVGLVPYEEIPAHLSLSDIFVRPSLSEGMGNSFIEAMAAGIPVVATPVGGIPDFLFDPNTSEGKEKPTGLFCNVRDPQSIADAVQRIVDDNALRETIIANARDLVRRSYDWNLIAKDMEEKVFTKVFDSER